MESVRPFCCPSGLRIRDSLEIWISLAARGKHPLTFKSHFTFLTSPCPSFSPKTHRLFKKHNNKNCKFFDVQKMEVTKRLVITVWVECSWVSLISGWTNQRKYSSFLFSTFYCMTSVLFSKHVFETVSAMPLLL